ncbi:hypothetical protein [Devosia sp.]|uniref:hypothetical protein n=1 Tax=Devosia sp. TaxID=1871048 RepID=UPI001A06CBF3|nr:hypothetical protein [Devosia sp.]MBE0581906.1 hypothetical protein [Devosia sp.]
MKASIIVGVFVCAALSLTIVGIALWTSAAQPMTDTLITPAADEENPFTRGSDTVVGNETPFRPEW